MRKHEASGTCANVLNGLDPRNACALDCNGAGGCQVPVPEIRSPTRNNVTGAAASQAPASDQSPFRLPYELVAAPLLAALVESQPEVADEPFCQFRLPVVGDPQFDAGDEGAITGSDSI
jgi:hypothetical protein